MADMEMDMKKYKDKFKFAMVDVDKCANSTFQARKKNFGVDIEELQDSIEVNGIMQPIGVAKSEVTQKSDIYDWEIVWGQRRHYAANALGMKKIPAMCLDRVLTESEGKALSVVENRLRVNMQTKDIWDAIKTVYVEFGTGKPGDAKLIAEKTGIPRSLVADAIQVNEISHIKGGEKTYNLLIEKHDLTKSKALEVLRVCKKKDGLTADEKKADEFGEYLAAQKNSLQEDTIKVAKANPGASVKEWIQGGKDFVATKGPSPRKIQLNSVADEALVLSATQEGILAEELGAQIIIKKLKDDGFI